MSILLDNKNKKMSEENAPAVEVEVTPEPTAETVAEPVVDTPVSSEGVA